MAERGSPSGSPSARRGLPPQRETVEHCLVQLTPRISAFAYGNAPVRDINNPGSYVNRFASQLSTSSRLLVAVGVQARAYRSHNSLLVCTARQYSASDSPLT